MATPEEAKLDLFLAWLQKNGVQLRGCNIKYCDSNKGFGVFSSNNTSDGVLLVVPLDLAITPMRVLQDPLLGPECRAMFEEGEVDDRFLMILFLTVERLRKNSSWKPYLDMLPATFRSPLWFAEDEFLELKGTSLYRATELQRHQLKCLYEDKVKNLVGKFLTLAGETERENCFEDFLWANSVFWTRALNLPLPHSYVFPRQEEDLSNEFCSNNETGKDISNVESRSISDSHLATGKTAEVAATTMQNETVWVEGLVPGIDFCNHDLRAVATWEVDGSGSVTGVPYSMYLLAVGQGQFENEKEIRISYGNKGNEELLYLYGFVIDNNPDDYLMVHYPAEAISSTPFSDAKSQLLEAQNVQLRCLLPRNLLHNGFFPVQANRDKISGHVRAYTPCSFSWSGQRKMPSYAEKFVFPDDFLTALRTISMQQNELSQVSHLLEELVGPEGSRQLSETEVRAAVWEACGDSGALQLLVDLLQTKMMKLEEGTGTEVADAELLEKVSVSDSPEQHMVPEIGSSGCTTQCNVISRNRRAAIFYRRGQKELTRLFLKEAEHALQLALSEDN